LLKAALAGVRQIFQKTPTTRQGTLYRLGKPGADLTGYREHDQSNQWWLGARRDNRSVALDLVTVGGRRVGAAGYRFRILDALHKAGLCHPTLQSRDRDCPRRRDGGHWICCRVRIRRPVELVSQANMS